MSENKDHESVRTHAPDELAYDRRGNQRISEPWACLICVRVEDVSAWTFPHDRFGACRQCGKPVQFRPQIPKPPRRPPMVCLQCALDLVRASQS